MLKLSVSSMDTYEKCPKKYHYTYIEKPNIQKQKWGHTEFGSCAHKMLELFHLRHMKDPFDQKEAPAIMKECFVKALEEFDLDLLSQNTWSPKGEVSGLVLLKNVMQNYLYKLKREGMPKIVGVEVPYSFKHSDSVEVRGFIDRIDLIAPGHYGVVDYKTSKSADYLTPRQLTVYAEAITRAYPDVKKLSGKYIMLKLDCEEVKWDFNQDDLNKLIINIDKIASAIKTETKWLKKPTALCNFCDFKSICQDTWAEGD